MKKIFLLCLLSSTLLLGQNNTLDSTFAKNGVFRQGTPVLPNSINLLKIIQKSDGKILLLMREKSSLFLNQILSNGKIDLSFGINGKAIISEMPLGYDLRNCSITPDQKLLGSGIIPATGNTFTVRLFDNGKLDTSFGKNGFITDVFGKDLVTNIIGEIFFTKNKDFFILGNKEGDSTLYQWTLAKYKANGNLDSSFDGGIVSNTAGENSSSVIEMAEQNDGKLIAYGT